MSADSTNAPSCAKPIHVHQVGGHPVRFFAPVNGSLDFPWACLIDVLDATELSVSAKGVSLGKVTNGEYADALRRVKAPGAELMIAPSYIYEGLLHSLAENGIVPSTIWCQLLIASGEAFKSMYSDRSSEERAELMFSIVRQNRDDEFSNQMNSGDAS